MKWYSLGNISRRTSFIISIRNQYMSYIVYIYICVCVCVCVCMYYCKNICVFCYIGKAWLYLMSL